MQDPKLEIYNAINHIASETTASLQQTMQILENATKALDEFMTPIYNDNDELTKGIKAKATVGLSALETQDGVTYAKIVTILHKLRTELEQTKDEVKGEMSALPLTDNPELLKRCQNVRDKVLEKCNNLDRAMKGFSKEIARQSLLFKSKPKLLDQDHAKKINDNFANIVQPIIHDVSNLKTDLINTLNGKKEAAKDKKEIDNVPNKPSSPKLGGRGG
jgi:hypothetical protein